ncbi:MAG: SprB repeat-containing protein, partial [Bacteroidetes bacterium]|nr:SprB repeat-containing protein [Bacteroidota bacterium]
MFKTIRIYILICLFSSIPFWGYSTHVVGGSLTYVYNGGSSYTVTLKLYRDCCPTCAALPASVTISVLGYNGVAFSPSRDITMSLGTVTPVPANLPPCAQAPNPMPCTQEAIYTTTVNNLPPNPGGYHMYFQYTMRNNTISNIPNPGGTGESFYAYIPGSTVTNSLDWLEDFTLANGITVDNGTTAWSIAAGVPAPNSASVNNNRFEITGANNAQETWTSQVVNISSIPSGVNLTVDLSENGSLDPNDSIFVYYSLDGGPLIPFSINGFRADDFTSAVASQSGLIGNTVQIFIRVHYDANSPNSEIYRFDNIRVSGTESLNNFIANSNPAFNQFPPLFLCNGIPFTFDHSATDADGDSLVYSFYTPYNGENNAGPLDPTFSNNTAIFTPVVWQPSYSATNPLGGGSVTLNSSTGLLSGTPTALGQFVVGIKVKEYRNGVVISETLRDCQFNVINCPQTLAVSIAPINPTVCFGGTSTTITANPSGGTPNYTYLWNGVNPARSINVGAGTYSVKLSDASGCAVYASVTVTAFTVAITANAGADQTICTQNNPITTLNGSVSGASGGIWSGGAGTFSPNNTTLSGLTYSPTAAEITAGFVDLTLTTTGNGTCAAASDVVRIYFMGFIGTVSVTPTNVSCFGGNNGSIAINITGGINPNTYFWNTAPAQTTPTASNLTPGTYSVTITNGIGCTAQTSGTITQPTPLAVNATTVNVTCFGGTTGSVSLSILGGTPSYTYLWKPGNQTTFAITNITAGTYTATVSDSKGCQLTTTYTITQPPVLAVTLSSVNVSCFSGSNGSINSNATGGTAPYTYSWNPIAATSPNVSGLTAGAYT